MKQLWAKEEIVNATKDNVKANPTLAGTETELSGLEVNGVKYSMPSGGGGKEYFHCIRYYTDNNNQAYINIKNNSSAPFTITSLCTFLKNLGCTYFTNLYVCSGMAKIDGVTETIIGCYRQTAIALKINTANGHETNFGYIEDAVTEVE